MASLVFLNDSFSGGEEIATKLSQALGYRCLGQEVLGFVAEEYDVLEPRLLEAVEAPPSLFGMSSRTRSRCLIFLRARIAAFLREDNALYHGPAGPFLIDRISHITRVRVTANLDDRIARVAEQQRTTARRGRRILLRGDKKRQKWSRLVVKAEITDPSLYDLVVNLSEAPLDDALRSLSEAAVDKKFQTTTYSLKCVENFELTARAHAALADLDIDAQVKADDGVVSVRTKPSHHSKERHLELVREKVEALQGVEEVCVELAESLMGGIAETMR
ncbi:AAA family ATPase [Planctomycetota bacterium]